MFRCRGLSPIHKVYVLCHPNKIVQGNEQKSELLRGLRGLFSKPQQGQAALARHGCAKRVECYASNEYNHQLTAARKAAPQKLQSLSAETAKEQAVYRIPLTLGDMNI